MQQIAEHPELALGSPTWGWVAFAFAATDELQHGPGPPTVETPVTVVAAGADQIVDNAVLRLVAGRFAARPLPSRSPAPTTRSCRRPTRSARSSGRRSTERRRG